MARPEVSVVMSVHNGVPYLQAAVDSILSQSLANLEFIIVDDASTDGTASILDSCADARIVRLRNQQRLGLSGSLNRGLAAARGELVARQDADDLSLPGRLARQVEYLRRHGDVGLLGTAYYLIDAQARRLALYRQPLTDTGIRWQMLFHNAFCHSSVMFRRELAAGGEPLYDESLPYSQDYELWARLLKRTSAANLAEPLVAFRTHERATSTARRGEQQALASGIAAQQIAALAPQLSLPVSEVDVLRRWHNEFPRRLGTQDMARCRVLLELLAMFKQKRGVDAGVASRLQLSWIARIVRGVTLSQIPDLWRSGLLAAMCGSVSPSLLGHAVRRVISRPRPARRE